jgi:hypothetical protein
MSLIHSNQHRLYIRLRHFGHFFILVSYSWQKKCASDDTRTLVTRRQTFTFPPLFPHHQLAPRQEHQVCPHPSLTVFHVVLTRLHACVVVGAPDIHGSAMACWGQRRQTPPQDNRFQLSPFFSVARP